MPANPNSETGSAATAADPASGSGETESQTLELLQKQNAELLRNSRYRSLFLARLAHELRTPLTSILGFSEILLNQEKLTDAQRNFCERIQSSAHQLQNSLNQLSDLARLEAGQTKPASEEFSLAELLRESVTALAHRAQKKRVTIECQVADSLPPVTSDRGRVRQILYNVLAYAITRSPEGDSVGVIAEINSQFAQLTIRDRGDALANPLEIGLLEADNDQAGTGELGLALARQNIQILGGAMSADNVERGLEVKITLPATAS
ncbi:MAG TPA: HAMP domain-containing sensor histidine kinase [Pyrinomonadaceae bacterium]|nr:HAMP domain-containing sensor histidine kinase [Pyrinomonadaceae bacterium]